MEPLKENVLSLLHSKYLILLSSRQQLKKNKKTTLLNRKHSFTYSSHCSLERKRAYDNQVKKIIKEVLRMFISFPCIHFKYCRVLKYHHHKPFMKSKETLPWFFVLQRKHSAKKRLNWLLKQELDCSTITFEQVLFMLYKS